jgi:2-deoxy-scyllo-inosamine dehydrogenase (SAM-dependent)
MNDRVLETALDKLARVNFAGRLSYHFYNEPLLRRDLERVVRKVAERLPNVYQVLYTNGDLLTDKRYKSLLEAGISYFKVTSHSLKSHPDRPFQEVLFPSDLELTNRGGIMSNLPKTTPDVTSLPCYAPSEMLIVTVTGDVLLCCDDARRRYVMGNIVEYSLEEIWLSEQFTRIRCLLSEGRRAEASDICRLCTSTLFQFPGTAQIP